MKQKETMKKDKNKVWITVISVVLGGTIAVLLDRFIDISFSPLQDVAKVVYSTITVIAGIWITCYLLFLELFKDRYPVEAMKSEQLPHMGNIFILIFFDVVYGCLVVLFEHPFFASVWFVLVSLVSVAIISWDVYHAHHTLMVNTYIDKFFDRVSKSFDASECKINTKALEQIRYIFEESLGKEEYYIARNISKKTGETFRAFLKNHIRMAEVSNSRDIAATFKNIAVFHIELLDLCKNLQSELLIEELIEQQYQNLQFCIEHEQYAWFKEYLHRYNRFVFQMHREENAHLTDLLYVTYMKLLKNLIRGKKEEWIEYALEELESLTFTYIYAYNKLNLRNYAMLLVNAIEISVKEKNSVYYQKFFDKPRLFTRRKCGERGAFNDIKIYYSYLFSTLIQEDHQKAYDFLEMILQCRVKGVEDAALLEFKLYGVDELSKQAENHPDIQERLFENHIDVMMEVVDLKRDYDGYLVLPAFFERIKAQDCPNEKIENTLAALKRLLNYCLIKDNIPAFYTLLKEIREALSSTQQQQKTLQKALLEIYYWVFSKTTKLVNQQFFEIAFDSFAIAIEQLDKNNAISSDLGQTIIRDMAHCAQSSNKENRKLTVLIIDLLFTFSNKESTIRFVSTDVHQKRLLFKSLFNIGTHCVENNFEEGLRLVSNAIGWLIIYSIEQMPDSLTIYLIGRANELLYISKKMEVTQKTYMFLLTLYTTVGAYCCKELYHKKYLDCVLKGIKNESLEHIKVAASLRTSENDIWNDLFEGKTKQLTNEFVKQFEASQKVPKGKKSTP